MILNRFILIYINKGGNHLNGTIPIVLTTINSLEQIELRDNVLSGTIPDEISLIESLIKLSIGKDTFLIYLQQSNFI